MPERGPVAAAEAVLAQLDLVGQVGQLVQTPNLDPVRDAEDLARGLVGSTILASGPLAGRDRDAGADRERLAALRDAARTPLLVARDVVHGHRTVFPVPLGMAAGFDEGLVEETSAWAAAEAHGDGVDWVFAPAIDVAVDARWGRVAESYGESPRLNARLGAAAVRGTQRSGRVAACAKHFVGYGLVRGGRDYAAVDVGMTALRERYLPPFRAAVDAGAMSLMAGFPAVDGVPMHAHRALLRGVLRDEWGFDGVVVSDWDGIGELVAHGVARDRKDAARLAIEAGIDVDMASGCYAEHLVDLVAAGDVDPSLVRDAARRVLAMKTRLGLFGERAEPAAPAARDARALAARAARSAVVLAKADGRPALPAEGIVHVTGPFVDDGAALLGTWVLDGDPSDVATPARAFRALVGDRLVLDDGRFADLAAARAREAAVTVAIVGEHPRRSGEDSSVSDIGLPAGQLDFLRLLRTTADRLVVVVIAGRPLASAEVLGLADVLVLTAHPGIAADEIARVLEGAEPWGRLPITWPDTSGTSFGWTGEAPTGRPSMLSRYGDLRHPPALPFGSGRSWTTFAVDPPRLSDAVLTDSVEVTATVRNTGDRHGRELVLLGATPPPGPVSRGTELLDWSWVSLDAGESAAVTFTVTPADFADETADGPRLRHGRARLHVGPHAVAIDVA